MLDYTPAAQEAYYRKRAHTLSVFSITVSITVDTPNRRFYLTHFHECSLSPKFGDLTNG